jgi:hypothetical protein
VVIRGFVCEISVTFLLAGKKRDVHRPMKDDPLDLFNT